MPVDYSKCQVCGYDLGPDPMHVVIDNGRVTRHTYAHRRHRYVVVRIDPTVEPQVQTRTDLEIEALAFAFRSGELKEGWE
jgi:hypothetical protein